MVPYERSSSDNIEDTNSFSTVASATKANFESTENGGILSGDDSKQGALFSRKEGENDSTLSRYQSSGAPVWQRIIGTDMLRRKELRDRVSTAQENDVLSKDDASSGMRGGNNGSTFRPSLGGCQFLAGKRKMTIRWLLALILLTLVADIVTLPLACILML